MECFIYASIMLHLPEAKRVLFISKPTENFPNKVIRYEKGLEAILFIFYWITNIMHIFNNLHNQLTVIIFTENIPLYLLYSGGSWPLWRKYFVLPLGPGPPWQVHLHYFLLLLLFWRTQIDPWFGLDSSWRGAGAVCGGGGEPVPAVSCWSLGLSWAAEQHLPHVPPDSRHLYRIQSPTGEILCSLGPQNHLDIFFHFISW